MGSGVHSRCSLTGSCSDYKQNHYYYKSEGLPLRKSPEGCADKVAESIVLPHLQRVGMATGGVMGDGGIGMPW